MLEAIDVSVSLPDRSRKPLFGQSAAFADHSADRPFDHARTRPSVLSANPDPAKSTLGRAFLGIYRPVQGRVVFEGKDLADLSVRDLKRARLRIQMIFQDFAIVLESAASPC